MQEPRGRTVLLAPPRRRQVAWDHARGMALAIGDEVGGSARKRREVAGVQADPHRTQGRRVATILRGRRRRWSIHRLGCRPGGSSAVGRGLGHEGGPEGRVDVVALGDQVGGAVVVTGAFRHGRDTADAIAVEEPIAVDGGMTMGAPRTVTPADAA
ncbi:MAG TPA: hypothetical protein VLN49_04145 [Gemmatimonadaceae bacterium]|nr:hypothetical protein [Gemmatimonadaceae bacterium]